MTEPIEPADDTEPRSREAQKYRLRLREAEAERDKLREQLVNNQRNQIDQQISAAGLKPKAVWSLGHQPGDLLGDDGLPDPAKIKSAVAEARSELGIVGSTRLGRELQSGSGARREPVNEWASAFGPKDPA